MFQESFSGTPAALVSLEDVDRLSAHRLWVWLRRMFFSGDLDLVARMLLERKLIGTGSEAPEFLTKNLTGLEPTRDQITFGDLQRLTSVTLRVFLKRRFGVEDNKETTALRHFRSFGSAGHRFAEFLFGGSFSVGGSETMVSREFAEQLSLFDFRRQRAASAESVPSLFDARPVELSSVRRVTEGEWERLLELFYALLPLVEPETYTREYFRHVTNIAAFMDMFARLFPEQFAALPEDGPLTEFLRLVSLLGWVGILRLRIEESDTAIYFPEFPVLPREFEVQAGRMDRLDLFPNGSREALRSLRRDQFGSAIELVQLVRKFHGDVKFRVIDWKMAVGDDHAHMITAEDSLPLPRHVAQVQWYLLWLSLGEHLLMGNLGGSWPDAGHLSGELRYVLPSGDIQRIPVEPASDDLRERFRSDVVARWDDIAGKREHRLLGNRTISLLKGRPALVHSPVAQVASQIALISDVRAIRPVSALVETFREFTDDGKMVEVLHGKKGILYRLHVNRLHKAILDGSASVGSNFAWQRGGTIRCLLHQEKTPSMNLNFQKNFWKCFGCGAKGDFDFGGLPQEIASVMVPREPHARSGTYTKGKALVVPDAYRTIMKDAQAFLANTFPRSMGEAYLKNARRIDPRLAQSVGAGFGSDALIVSLLDAGHPYEDLVRYGFVHISDRASPTGWLPRLLHRRGVLQEAFVVRERLVSTVTNQVREVVKYPFPTMSGFVTFPLEIPFGAEPVITGFYGRKVPRDGRPITGLKHMVLCGDTIPKGMFGGREISRWIADGGIEKVYVTEGIMDALAMAQCGYGPVISIIGTGTAHLELLLAELNPGEIHVAMDFDDAGMEASARLQKSFRARGYQGPIEDFSLTFAINNAEVAALSCDDFATWWLRVGSRRARTHKTLSAAV